MQQRDSDDSNQPSGAAAAFAVGARVLIRSGGNGPSRGIIVEDFGDAAGYSVDVGPHHIANASRRWAVTLDDGNLVFVNTSDLASPTE